MAGPWEKYQAAPATPDGPWKRYQSDSSNVSQSSTSDSLNQRDETTVPGIAASVARGIAPMAAGAAAGGAVGSLAGGVGAIPGAALGAGAVGAHQLVTSLYNPMAEVFGWPQMATAQEMTDKVMDAIGVWRPATGIERGAEAVAGGAAGALGPARAAAEVAGRVASPVAKGIASQLAARPGVQVASGAAGGAGAQTAAEIGGGPTEQRLAGLAAGAVPYARGGIAAEPRRVAMEAHQAGYVLPPTEFSAKPGIVSSLMSGWGGKIKTYQDASEKNQPITTSLAKQDIGVPSDTALSPQIFDQVRSIAGQRYGQLGAALPVVNGDHAYAVIVANLGGRTSQARQLFPNIMSNPGIDDLIADLQSNQQFPGRTGIEIVKQLRYEAKDNLRSADPKVAQLGIAQRQAADAVDGLIERNLAARTGNKDLVDEYRAARQVIAKTYDVETATNFATGDVNAHRLAALAAKGRPLSGNLETIARVAAAFPKATQLTSKFGHSEPLSAIDFFAATGAVMAGHEKAAGLILGRPAARATVLSGPYQRGMAAPRQPATIPLPLLTQPGLGAVTSPAAPY